MILVIGSVVQSESAQIVASPFKKYVNEHPAAGLRRHSDNSKTFTLGLFMLEGREVSILTGCLLVGLVVFMSGFSKRTLEYISIYVESCNNLSIYAK
jgi:hypothetical protein